MKTLRRALSSLLAVVLAIAPLSSARAVSLYDGMKTPTTASSVLALPSIQALPILNPAMPLVLRTDIAVPQGLAVPAAQIETLETRQAQADSPRPLADLQTTKAELEAPGANAPAVLESLYVQRSADAGFATYVGGTIAEYFGVLKPNEQAGVVVAKRGKKSSTLGAPTDDEMVGDIKETKRTNAEREQVHIRMLQRSGAKYDPATALVTTPDFTRDGEVQLQEVPPSWGGRSMIGRFARALVGEAGAALGLIERPAPQHNIFVVKRGKPKPGSPERVIVHSGHIDKVRLGWGVVDNWVGTALQAHLYASVKDQDLEATHVFIAFTREEEGLVGSRHWLKSLAPEQRALIEGDANYDTFAIKGGQTNSWENNSHPDLLDLYDRAVAEANKTRGPGEQLSLVRGRLNGGDADSSTFAVGATIYSGPPELVFSKIHSESDEFGAFDPLGYKNVYGVAMAIIAWWDAHVLKSAPFVGAA